VPRRNAAALNGRERSEKGASEARASGEALAPQAARSTGTMNAPMARPTTTDPVRHPESDAAWFRALPPARQEEFHRACRERAERDLELERTARRRELRSAAEVAIVFALMDQCCPGRDALTLVLAATLGAAVGFTLERRNAGHVLSGSGALVAFFLLQTLTRGGLSAVHLFWFFPVGALCAILALRRETGD